MDQRGSTYWKRATTILEPGRGEPRVRPISFDVASLLSQEPEEELNKLLLMKVSDRDQNVKVKMLVVLRLSKTCYSILGHAFKTFRNVCVNINNHIRSHVHTCKYIGIVTDKQCSWNDDY